MRTLNERLKAVKLPKELMWFEDAQGHVAFPLYGASGGITNRTLAYLIFGTRTGKAVDLGTPYSGVINQPGGWKSHAVEIDALDWRETERRIAEAGIALLKTKAISA